MPIHQTVYTSDTQRRAAFLLLTKLREQEAQDRKLPWRPNPGAQTMALFNKADELLYGGAAGGGKTDLLLGAAATVQYKSIIFRRQFPQLKDIIGRSREMYAAYPSARYRTHDHTWLLPFGRTLEFGAMPLFDDREKFQGRPHDGKLFDEITQIDRGQYTYVNGWTRTTRRGQRFRSICTGNPPTSVDGEWIIEYWAPWLDLTYDHPATAGEIRWFATLEGKSVEVKDNKPFYAGGQLIEPRSRSYVPARLTDNPFLRDTGYSSVVNAMPEPLRSLLLFGFEAKLPPDIDPWAVIPPNYVDTAAARWRAARANASSLPITSIGVDTARGGADRTVIAIKRGNFIDELRVHDGRDTPSGDVVAQKVLEAIGISPSLLTEGIPLNAVAAQIPINIDIIGANGSSCYDTLKRAGFNAFGVHGNAPSGRLIREHTLKTQNLRSEMYWIALREQLDPDYGTRLMLPDNRELRQELLATRWQLSPSGQIILVQKEKIEKRLGRSPDMADAVALACVQMDARSAPPPPPSVGGRSYGNTFAGYADEAATAGTQDERPTPQGYDPADDLVYVPGVGMVPAEAVERLVDNLSQTGKTRVEPKF